MVLKMTFMAEMDRLVTMNPFARISLFVDDLAIQTFDEKQFLTVRHEQAILLAEQMFERLELPISSVATAKVTRCYPMRNWKNSGGQGTRQSDTLR